MIEYFRFRAQHKILRSHKFYKYDYIIIFIIMLIIFKSNN